MLKNKQEAFKGKYMEELLGVLWAIRTSSHGATNETSFSFIYRIEVVIPKEEKIHTIRSTLLRNNMHKQGWLTQSYSKKEGISPEKNR